MCIDLIFISLPNLIIDSGVHSPLHPNCHHQTVYARFNLEIIYPPPHLREVWQYKDANIQLIRRTINGSNWTRVFSNTSVNEKVNIFKVNIFNNTILNILSNFIPHKILTCDDKDPSWFNKKIKGIIQEKNAPSFPAIVHFLIILIILLKNDYLQSHFQSKLLARLFKILTLIKHMVMIT